jgi:hypothetical protein
MLRPALLGVLLAVSLTAQAQAREPIVDSNPVAEAAARAARYWGGTPCAGHVRVVAGTPGEAPAAGLNASGAGSVSAMWSTWASPSGINELISPPASFTACVVHINPGVWSGWLADDGNFPAFCKEMVHEYGHFEGFPDAGAVQGTVEYERPDLAHVPVCERFRLTYGRRTFAAPASPRRGSARGSAQPGRSR